MKLFKPRDPEEIAELSKLVDKEKVSDIRNYNYGKNEERVKDDSSMKSARGKLGTGRGKMYVVKKKQGNVTSNFEYIVKPAQTLFAGQYSAQSSHATFIGIIDEQDTDAPSTISDEARRALKDIAQRKAVGKDGITIGLTKDGEIL